LSVQGGGEVGMCKIKVTLQELAHTTTTGILKPPVMSAVAQYKVLNSSLQFLSKPTRQNLEGGGRWGGGEYLNC